jgi:hypothetical protein
MHDEDIDIVIFQEAHARSEENLPRRETIPGHTLIGAVYSKVHGIATYVKASFSNCRVVVTIVVKVYKPPSAIAGQTSRSNFFLTMKNLAGIFHLLIGSCLLQTPGWNLDCENLYQEYNTNHDRVTANRLLEELNDQRKRKWEKNGRSAFIHSSQKPWSLP